MRELGSTESSPLLPTPQSLISPMANFHTHLNTYEGKAGTGVALLEKISCSIPLDPLFNASVGEEGESGTDAPVIADTGVLLVIEDLGNSV